MPTIDNLYALSDLFQVPIDLLVCGNRKPLALCDNAHNESNERVYEYYERINEWTCSIIIKIIILQVQ